MSAKRRLRRGIYLLPTVFTLGNLLCGFTSVILAAHEEYARAAALIVLAGILDGLDGRIARMTGATSEFGVQFDSLADIVSFGVAPGILAFHWALAPLNRLGWVLAFLFLVCGAMRLARYNIQATHADRRFFAGLPSTAAAGSLAATVFAFPDPSVGWITVARAILATALSLLMISRFRYRSFSEVDLKNRRSYVYVLPVAMVIVGIAIEPRVAMMIVAVLYVSSAPLFSLVSGVQRAFSNDVRVVGDEVDATDETAVR